MLVFRGLFQTKNKTKNNIVMHTEDLDMQNIPQHIAIIMDGNGRWAKAQARCAPLADPGRSGNTENYCPCS